MTFEDAKKAIEEVRAQGIEDDEIIVILYKMFQADQIDINQLEALVEVAGYELTDEFKGMSPEDQKTKGLEEIEEEIDEEKIEEAKELSPEEAKELKDEKPEVKIDTKDEENDDEEQAGKLFGLDFKNRKK